MSTKYDVFAGELKRSGDFTVAQKRVLRILGFDDGTFLTGPDFTYDPSGTLTKIEYDNGTIKMFTYDPQNLVRVDEIREDTTRRKEFFYSPNGELDYIKETFL